MSNIWAKLVTGFIVLLVVVCLVTTIRTDLLSDGAAYEIFISALDCFPFAQTMANIANKICGSQVLVGLTMRSVVSELTTLFGMTVICPVVMGATSRIFLKIPTYTDWYDREQYMQTWSYRLKSALLNVVMMPACTLITMVLLDRLLAVQDEGSLPPHRCNRPDRFGGGLWGIADYSNARATRTRKVFDQTPSGNGSVRQPTKDCWHESAVLLHGCGVAGRSEQRGVRIHFSTTCLSCRNGFSPKECFDE